MAAADLILRGRRIVLPGGTAPAALHLRDGIIAAVTAPGEVPAGSRIVDLDERLVVMPGLVDSHVHINEPGRTEWEGFETATRAAAAGGVTTLVDMPLNSIPATTTLDNFRTKLAAAEGRCCVDLGFWGGVIPGNTPELGPLFDAGVVGFKCFLIDSGVDEFPCVAERDLRAAMPELARLGATLIFHAELPGPIEHALSSGEGPAADPRKYATFLRSRPREAEDEAVALIIRLCREFGGRVHIVHHSSADSLDLLRQARADRLPLTVETCPHYLSFAAEDIPDGATEFKCCPPIRERDNREQLWAALRDGVIDMIVSDHSPSTPELKRRDTGSFMEAWGGISSLQFRLPIVWTEARRRGHPVEALARWLSASPARLVGLDERKGAIAPGFDADLVIWDPEADFVVEPSIIHHRHKLTPYAGRALKGKVRATFLRGRKIYEDGEFLSGPSGAMLKRGAR